MREPFATNASMSDEPPAPRNGSEAESEDPQLVANRGANSITARLRRPKDLNKEVPQNLLSSRSR